MKLNKHLINTFKIPLLVLTGMILYGLLLYFQFAMPAMLIILSTIVLGSFQLFGETFKGLLAKQFALDYLAILAIVVSLLTQEYLVAAVIALMITSGRTLEEYGVSQAKKSLTLLVDRIPTTVTLWRDKKPDGKLSLHKVQVGQEIVIRRGEVIPLDGTLLSEQGLTDESSLTGEPYTIEKIKGDTIRSGTVNIGDVIVVRVTRAEKDSTYRKIITMVENAQEEKAPMVRMADRYSTIFTVISLSIAGFAYLSSHDLTRVLSVLVIATPCPLILATPIALLGGVNASAKQRIIVKRLKALEVLSRINTLIFDKTGTITLGKPTVSSFDLKTKRMKKEDLLAIAESIERNSLHPLAKAIVNFAKENNVPLLHAEKVTETIGKGIQGIVSDKPYQLQRLENTEGMAIELSQGKTPLAIFRFEDEIKQEAKDIIKELKRLGLSLKIFTGDKRAAAEKVVQALGENVDVKAECTPEDKKIGIELLKKQGQTTAMVGDGINDAPALALADVGLVFSNEEQTAASEAADIVFLGGDFSHVYTALRIAKQTIRIALTSILVGIGLSIFGMLIAAVGFIPPLIGAGLQEAIDVIAILNALRATRVK